MLSAQPLIKPKPSIDKIEFLKNNFTKNPQKAFELFAKMAEIKLETFEIEPAIFFFNETCKSFSKFKNYELDNIFLTFFQVLKVQTDAIFLHSNFSFAPVFLLEFQKNHKCL